MKIKWLTIGLCALLALGVAAGTLAYVFAANTDITGRLTYTYDVKDKNGDTVSGTDYAFKDGIYTVVIGWNLSNAQPALETGDYFVLPFVFAGNITNITMSNYTFDFTGTKPSDGPGTAGTATLSKADGTTWNLRAVFNDYLKNLNNLSGSFTIQFSLNFPDDSSDQEWKINDTMIAAGENPKEDITIADPNVPWPRDPRLYKGTGTKIIIAGVENNNHWASFINMQSHSKEGFFNLYKNYDQNYDGSVQPSIHITDALGPGQTLLPYPVWQSSGNWAMPAVAKSTYFRQGGPDDTEAYFVACLIDLREMWAYFADPNNKAFIDSVILEPLEKRVNPDDYAIIPGTDYIPEGKTSTLGQTGLSQGGVPITNNMLNFITFVVWANGGKRYSATTQPKVNAFCESYIEDAAPYMSNVERTASGFSFDLDTDAIDGKLLMMHCFSTVVNPAQLPGDPKQITNTLGLKFAGLNEERKSVGGHWLTGDGDAVGDENTLTIFKRGPAGKDLSGAVFTVERLGDNPITTGGAVNGKITLTTTASGGLSYATTGPLGSYGPDEIYKITEITPPVGMIAFDAPIYLKIDPDGYAVTLCDASGGELPETILDYGLCDTEGSDGAALKCLWVNNYEPATFTNKYKKLVTSVIIGGEKAVKGKNPPNETFNFTLTQVANARGGEYTEGTPITRSASITGAGTFEFLPKIDNLAEGVYYFLMEETPGSGIGWRYDDTTYLVTVTVEGEPLEAKIVIKVFEPEPIRN